MPFELRPEPTPTLLPEGDYLQTTWENSVYPMAEQMGTHIVLPNVSPQPYTHLAFEGYQYAKEKGKGNEYNHRMFTAFFQEEQDIGSKEVLTDIAGEIGLNQQEFREVLKSRKYKKVHEQALHHAYHEVKIQAVPTFIIGSVKVQGIATKHYLEQIIHSEMKN
jgi:predicted DsbA family dithiol-disulfide isomerase